MFRRIRLHAALAVVAAATAIAGAAMPAAAAEPPLAAGFPPLTTFRSTGIGLDAPAPAAATIRDEPRPELAARRYITPTVALADFAPAGSLQGNGHQVRVSGHIQCAAGALVRLRVTLTQTASGATGAGETVFTCAGPLQTWSALVVAPGRVPFQAGGVQACGGVTDPRGRVAGTVFQWCRTAGPIAIS